MPQLKEPYRDTQRSISLFLQKQLIVLDSLCSRRPKIHLRQLQSVRIPPRDACRPPLSAFALGADRLLAGSAVDRQTDASTELDTLDADISALRSGEIATPETALTMTKIPRLILP